MNCTGEEEKLVNFYKITVWKNKFYSSMVAIVNDKMLPISKYLKKWILNASP